VFAPCETLARSYYKTTNTSVTAENDTAICTTVRARVTYSVGGPPPPTATIYINSSVVPDFELEPEVPTPWARKGARYQPMSKVKDVWRAKWRLVQQRPRDGLHNL